VSSASPTPSGLLLVLSGPSGAGKTTITHAVEQKFGGVFSVSATTRAPGPGEVHGRDYLFITPEQFQRWIDEKKFLEYAQVFGRSWYGTPRDPVEAELHKGRLVILDIDVQGALQVKRALPNALMVFVTAPDESALRQRLIQRGRDEPAAIQRRLEEARKEIETARSSGQYDCFVINDQLDRALDQVCNVVAQRLEPSQSRR
jgi:guanylate kinase